MKLISRLFGKSEATSETLCPHCEKAMEAGHKCAAMSRRFFFRMLGGVAAGGAILGALPAAVEGSPLIVPAFSFPQPYDMIVTNLGFTFQSTKLDTAVWNFGDWRKYEAPRYPVTVLNRRGKR